MKKFIGANLLFIKDSLWGGIVFMFFISSHQLLKANENFLSNVLWFSGYFAFFSFLFLIFSPYVFGSFVDNNKYTSDPESINLRSEYLKKMVLFRDIPVSLVYGVLVGGFSVGPYSHRVLALLIAILYSFSFNFYISRTTIKYSEMMTIVFKSDILTSKSKNEVQQIISQKISYESPNWQQTVNNLVFLTYKIKLAWRRTIQVSFSFHEQQNRVLQIMIKAVPLTRWKQEDYDYLKRVVDELKQSLLT